MSSETETIVIDQIGKIASAVDGSFDLTPETPLLEQQLLDSVEMLQLVLALETELSITVPLEELTPDNFVSARAIAGLVDRVRAAG